MSNILFKSIGWKATLIQGDITVTDRWRWLRDWVKSEEGKPLRILDAGCGSGGFTTYCALAGHEAVGLSFDDGQLQKARQRADLLGLKQIEFHQVDLRELDQHAKGLGTFDLILLLETLEHIINDAKAVADVCQLLRPGGFLLVTTPSDDHHPLWGETLSTEEDGGHVRWGYSHAALGDLLRQQQLDIVAEDDISGWVSQKLTSWEFGLRTYNPLLSRALLPLRVLHFLDEPLTKALNYPYLSVGAIAKKKTAAEALESV